MLSARIYLETCVLVHVNAHQHINALSVCVSRTLCALNANLV